MTRDPRKNPRPGDATRDSDGDRFIVIDVYGTQVRYFFVSANGISAESRDVRTWADWAKRDTVTHLEGVAVTAEQARELEEA